MRGRSPLVPERKRRIPGRFSWIDHRLVRDGYLRGLSAQAQALYLFLVTVSDADGLSWYSESSACRHLGCDEPSLRRARSELVDAQLVAYRNPLSQVLGLDPLREGPIAVIPAGTKGGSR